VRAPPPCHCYVPNVRLASFVLFALSAGLLGAVLGATPSRAEDVPPPPPVLVPEELQPETVEPLVEPAEPAAPEPPPTLAPEKAPVKPDPPAAPIVTQTHLLPGAARGAMAGAAGAAFGASMGAAVLFWGAFLGPDVPELALLVVGAATPAVAAFFGGTSMLAFVVEAPTADDWGSVAACTAVGCIAVGLAVLGGAGGLSVGTGCGTGACGDPIGGSSSRGSHAATWATAGSGVGTATGLAVGALTGLILVAGEPSPSVNASGSVAVSAGVGALLGAIAGGAIGGAIGGNYEDEAASFRDAAPPRTRTAPGPRGRY
jgi:hypothetical protein